MLIPIFVFIFRCESLSLSHLCIHCSHSRSHVTTDGQSVSQYVKVSSPLRDLCLDITFCQKFVFWKLLSCLCGAPSLTRGRVCHLSFSVRSNLQVLFWRWKWSHVTTEGQSVSMSWRRAHFGTCDQILILSEFCCLLFHEKRIYSVNELQSFYTRS
jgi:hypothetical protein